MVRVASKRAQYVLVYSEVMPLAVGGIRKMSNTMPARIIAQLHVSRIICKVSSRVGDLIETLTYTEIAQLLTNKNKT
jgi:hypothetical protein